MPLDPNREAARLFMTFARFEYALKRAGFHRGEGKAEPHWTNFALAIAAEFEAVDDPAFVEALKYFKERPPKRQVIRDGELDWDDAPVRGRCEADHILLYVRRVRNNLFHGGKFNGRWFEPQRSAELLRHSMTILETCRRLSPALNEAFEL
jgi:hypothetical protein